MSTSEETECNDHSDCSGNRNLCVFLSGSEVLSSTPRKGCRKKTMISGEKYCNLDEFIEKIPNNDKNAFEDKIDSGDIYFKKFKDDDDKKKCMLFEGKDNSMDCCIIT